MPVFHIWAYMPSRQMWKEKIHRFSFLQEAPGLKVMFGLPIESLNPRNLKTMRKGVHPLQNLKAMKICFDAGVESVAGFYFYYYPLETVSSVNEEVYFLKNTLHLFCIPGSRWEGNYYWASRRDTIAAKEEQYGIRHHKGNDPWLKKIINVDLPLGDEVPYTIAPPRSIQESITCSYYKLLINLAYSVVMPMRIRNIIVSASSFLIEFIRFVGLQAAAGNFVYMKRIMILIYIEWWQHKHGQKGYIVPNVKLPGKKDNYPEFYLHGATLVKKYPREKWKEELSPMELEILRFLYQPRERANIFDEFANKYSEKSIEDILEKHLRLKSIIIYKKLLMSIFNDREYVSKQCITEYAIK